MNHFKNIQERVKVAVDDADHLATHGDYSNPATDLAKIVHSLAQEVATLARLLAEPMEQERRELELHEQAQNLTPAQGRRLAELRK